MRISVSLPDVDVEFLDAYGVEQGVRSRSAVVHRAVRLLRASELEPPYEAAWEEWAAGDADAWDAVAADGLV